MGAAGQGGPPGGGDLTTVKSCSSGLIPDPSSPTVLLALTGHFHYLPTVQKCPSPDSPLVDFEAPR